jgi:hypothetical protein
MKQSKTLFTTLVFAVSMYLLSGCTPDEKGLWIKHQLAQKAQEKAASKQRSPAQSAPRCFVDRFQDSLIQEEVNKMEAAYGEGKHAAYQHGDMSFADLPQATIDALKNNYNLVLANSSTKSWIAQDPKQKDCKDFPCFINALYANPTNEGLLHYWYFLKTGYPFAALNLYPWQGTEGQNLVAEGFDLESYLMDKNEWKAMWMAANLLPKSMLFMPSLKAIHRLPHKFFPETWKTKGVAAWAVGYWSAGEILLSDWALTLNPNYTFDTKMYFYQASTHEIAHRLSSWNFAGKGGPARSADQEPDFLALSSWQIERLAQPDGTFVQRWKNNGQSLGWPSEYAKSSPAEDFAEMVGIFRTNPSNLKVRASAKYDYAKRKVFANHGYTVDDLKEQYTNDLSDALVDRVDEWITPCVAGNPGATLTAKQMTMAKLVQVKLPVDSKIKTCIQKQVVATVLDQINQIRYNEPEGCLTMDNFEGPIANEAITRSVSDLNEYLKTYEKLTDLMTGVQGFRSSVAQEFDGRALVLACWQDKDPGTCYEGKLSAEFERLFQKYKVLLSSSQADLAEIEHKRFMSSNAYDKMYGDVVQFYDSFFVKYSDEIKDRTGQIWQACLAVPSRVNTNVLMEPYSPGSLYVSPAVIQCLNEKLPEEMTAIRAEAGAEQGVNILSPEAREWVTQRILLPRFKVLLDSKVQEAGKNETTQLESLKQPTIDSAFEQLTRDSAWRRTGYSYPGCKAAARPLVQDGLKADSYRFFAIDPVVDSLGDQVCEKVRAWITANPNARNKPTANATPVKPETPAVPTDSQKKELDPYWSKFQPLLVVEAETRFDTCRQKIYFAQRLKRFCLFTMWVVDDQDSYRKTAWNWTKDRAAHKWMSDSEVKAFMTAKGYSEAQVLEVVRARAEDERQDLGDAILERFYGGNSAASTEN